MAQESTSVDLGSSVGEEPKLPGATEGSDAADASSQSPLAQSRGGAEPTDIGLGLGSQDFEDLSLDGSNVQSDPANDHAWSLQGDHYTPKY